MAHEIKISRPGSGQVVETMNELARQTSRTHSFGAFGSSMNEYGAFRGFLSLFKDTYTTAHHDLVDCLEQAYQAAFDFEDAIALARKDILRADEGVAERHRQLAVSLTGEAPGTGPGHSTPGWPDRTNGPLVAGNTVHSALNDPEINEAIVKNLPNPPQHAAPHTPTHSPLSVLDAAQQAQAAVHHAQENDEARDDEDKMDDYLERRDRD
ncbi:hypothetical protein [Nocardioides sp.]|uniref:hypothetical protein n=1 Tax=Nocardioides sp. TaxID=35761 RepID=UPI002C5B7352|nr:hypothetical protein [Nocardioides sp.]HXH78332.1 hypothetical protein [Nocardioides sp.]